MWLSYSNALDSYLAVANSKPGDTLERLAPPKRPLVDTASVNFAAEPHGRRPISKQRTATRRAEQYICTWYVGNDELQVTD